MEQITKMRVQWLWLAQLCRYVRMCGWEGGTQANITVCVVWSVLPEKWNASKNKSSNQKPFVVYFFPNL